jgi:hypothetical protein
VPIRNFATLSYLELRERIEFDVRSTLGLVRADVAEVDEFVT